MTLDRTRRFSYTTLALGAYIIISASFMLQVNLWLTATVGDPLLYRSFWVASAAVVAAFVCYAVLARIGFLRALLVAAVFVAAYLLGESQRYFAEKTHILTYGLLGYLAARDMAGASGARMGWAGSAVALAYVAIVSALDEGFQRLLPYRFGELGDFMTNVLSGALGLGLFAAASKRRGA